jgi:dual specificity tyrosine-phosphorylation-regulated kinase 2/3/4
LLARVISICGPFPEEVFQTGRLVNKFFTKDKLLYQPYDIAKQNKHLSDEMVDVLKQKAKGKQKYEILVPKRTTLKARVRTEDTMFLNFIKFLLDTDKDRRPSATQALAHPWIRECKYIDGLP